MQYCLYLYMRRYSYCYIFVTAAMLLYFVKLVAFSVESVSACSRGLTTFLHRIIKISLPGVQADSTRLSHRQPTSQLSGGLLLRYLRLLRPCHHDTGRSVPLTTPLHTHVRSFIQFIEKFVVTTAIVVILLLTNSDMTRTLAEACLFTWPAIKGAHSFY